MPRQVLRNNLVNPRLLASNVRLHQQHESRNKMQEKIQQRAREGGSMSAIDLLEETKTPDDQLETETA